MLEKLINNIILPIINLILFIDKGSWREKKINVFVRGILFIPLKKLRKNRRERKFVENQYDHIAGSYIRDNY